MRHGISFRKLKITNNKDKPGQNVQKNDIKNYKLQNNVINSTVQQIVHFYVMLW